MVELIENIIVAVLVGIVTLATLCGVAVLLALVIKAVT